jgi:hypothetical protein
MKTIKKFSPGLILIYIFLISTVAMIVILLGRFLTDESSKVIIHIWLGELFLVIIYCLVFYDSGQARKSGKNNLSAMRHQETE